MSNVSNLKSNQPKPVIVTTSGTAVRSKPPRDLSPAELRVSIEGYDPSLDRRLNGKSGK